MDKKPVLFSHTVQVRFSDIDRYQHVNTVYYPDYVFTSRFEFLKKKFGLPHDHFERLGMGFFTIRSDITYRRGIPATLGEVRVDSNVTEVNRNVIKIQFKIIEPTREQLFSNGTFEFMMVDLKTQKPMDTVPEEVLRVVYE